MFGVVRLYISGFQTLERGFKNVGLNVSVSGAIFSSKDVITVVVLDYSLVLKMDLRCLGELIYWLVPV